METHRLQTRFGPVDIRVYRLREGWWPVPVGPHRLPSAPVLPDGPLPQSVDDALQRMADLIDALPARIEVQFWCGTLVAGCPVGFRGAEEQVLRAVAAHAAADHGMAVLPDSLVRQVRASMTPAG